MAIFQELTGKIIEKIEQQGNDCISFETEEGQKWIMWHSQD